MSVSKSTKGPSGKRRKRAAGLALAWLGVTAVFSCGGSTTKPGGLMLAISSDGPLAIDRLDLNVQSAGQVLHDTHYRVPEEAALPTSIAIATNGDERAAVQITVVGRSGTTPVD